MSDLVDRLRTASVYERYQENLSNLGDEAADEIERQQQVIANMMIDAHVSADEIERLRGCEEALKEGGEIIIECKQEIERLHRLIAETQNAQRIVLGTYSGCPVCGLGADGKPMAYSCPRTDCPSAVT